MLSFLLKLRTRARTLLRLSDAHTMLMWSVTVGIAGAFATVAFREVIALLQRLVFGDAGGLVDLALRLPWPVRVAVPAVGGLIAGGFLLIARRSEPASTSDYMEAVAIGDGVVPVRASLWRSVSSLFTIASGGSIGREGPMVQLAALSASVIGRRLHFDPPRLRLLVACGAAAGITSAYNAPIAGAFFVTEILLGSIAMESFGPVLVASVVANITMRGFAGYRPAYEMPVFPPVTGIEVLLFVALGVLCGASAPQFLRLMDASKAGFRRLPLPLPLKLALGGLMVGILSVGSPDVWGNGYSVVNAILHSPWTWTALVTVLAFKIVATMATAGSGAVGGIFTPTLFVGAVTGSLFGLGMNALWPHGTSAAFAYAVVGMGAFLAGATQGAADGDPVDLRDDAELSGRLAVDAVVRRGLFCFARDRPDVDVRDHLAAQSRGAGTPAPAGDADARADPARRHRGVVVRYRGRHDAGFSRVSGQVSVCRRRGPAIPGRRRVKDITSDLLDKRDTSTRTAADYLQPEFDVLTPDMTLGVALQHFLAFQGGTSAGYRKRRASGAGGRRLQNVAARCVFPDESGAVTPDDPADRPVRQPAIPGPKLPLIRRLTDATST